MVRGETLSRRPTRQETRRKHDGKCFFCENPNPATHHCHRIVPGEDGGTYDWLNTLCVCANCHERIHDKQIIIKGRFLSTAGYVIIYEESGQECIKRDSS